MAQKVSISEIERLEHQELKQDKFVDGVDAIDRGSGRILSSIGKFIAENW